ncbi:MAG: SDR family NAD(P)-dependent oxidoreductase, partial [Bacteroidetes bacterium]
METNRDKIMRLVPAIRMILSSGKIRSGSFVPLDRLLETDPEKMAVRLGRTLPVFRGEPDQMLHEISRSPGDIDEYLFLDGLGLLGLANNQSKIEQKLGTVRKESRGTSLPEPVATPQLPKPLYNRIIAITGGAMGYGEGIARELFREGANLVVMDINEQAGKELVSDLNGKVSPNRALFVRADVTGKESMVNAVYETVLEFGGLEVMISNAGVLKAGSIEEMDPGHFDYVTRVNYTGYYNCVSAAVPVMKVQNHYAEWNFGDIIQINSKSGIEGSKRNFAYSGSKFGGIGLTQSFALELMEYRIKVNAIC